MNNFFLYKEALNTATLREFEIGIELLNDIFSKRNNQEDKFIKYEKFWEQNCNHGFFYEIPQKLSSEYHGLIFKLFESFISIEFDIPDENKFDILYNNDCNGFNGFDFTGTKIPQNRQITNLGDFNQFKQNHVNQIAYNSIQSFWENKEKLFPSLIFCERVWKQILHLSINDPRFTLINQKLQRLDSFTATWQQGVFDYSSLGLNNSPDTPTRIAKTEALRTFNCPKIGNQIFSLHIKWGFGGEPFRLYYYPNEGNHKVYIGYIGPKDQIGF